MPPADDTPAPDAKEVTAAPFGSQEPTRTAADVVYRGRVGEHEYLVQVRHRLLDTSFTVEIDGVAHDPKAEEKARTRSKKAGGLGTAPADQAPGTAGNGVDENDQADETDEVDEAEQADETDQADGVEQAEHADQAEQAEHADETDQAEQAEQVEEPDRDPDSAPSDGSPAPPGDSLRFRLEEHFTTLYCTVRRPDGSDGLEDAEVITIRTTGLGGAGEVDVRQGLTRRPLAPDADSPSAARDRKRTAHPTRYALLAALTKAAAFLLPLLGLGALFSGILQPARDWIAERLAVLIEAIMGVISPVLEWIDELLRPIREFIDSLTRPIRDLIAALLQPVRDLVDWLRSLLPELSLPFDVPDWVLDLAVPVIIVLVVFALTFGRLRTRRQRLEAARASAATTSASPAPTGPPQTPSDEQSAGAPRDQQSASTPDGDEPASTPDEQSAGAPHDDQSASIPADDEPAATPADEERAAEDPDGNTECSSPR